MCPDDVQEMGLTWYIHPGFQTLDDGKITAPAKAKA
jgi:hypothetical protein